MIPMMTPEQVDRKQRVKTAVYSLLASTSWASGLTWMRQSLGTSSSLRVLIYYKINSHRGNTLSIAPELFECQLRYLKAHYAVVSPEDVLGVIERGQPLPPRAVLLTFDDGYRDVYETAYPLLKQFGMKAALFPATDFIGTDRPFPHDERLSISNPTLAWHQVRQMMDVFTVGSHTKSHRRLTTLSLLEARDEIRSSKALLEDRLGTAVRMFCYPKGSAEDFNRVLEDEVREAGYLASFVTLTGPNSLARVRRGQGLRRYHVEPFSEFMFARLLDGSCDAIGLKDSRWGSSAKRTFNRVLQTSTR